MKMEARDEQTEIKMNKYKYIYKDKKTWRNKYKDKTMEDKEEINENKDEYLWINGYKGE